MPKVITETLPEKTKPTAPKPGTNGKPKGKPKKPRKTVEREVVYDELTVCDQVIDLDTTVINATLARDLLRWETEEEYAARKMEENPKLKKEDCRFDEDAPFVFEDVLQNRVCCWNNVHNRPFDFKRKDAYVQDGLNRNWKLNGETIIIGKTGTVISGQKTLVAVVEADMLLERARKEGNEHYTSLWPDGEEFHIRKLIVFGVEEEPEVIRTIDDVQPRSESDVMYTSRAFSGTYQLDGEERQLDKKERESCCRYLARCLDFVWVRSGAGNPVTQEGVHHQHKTNSEVVAFQDRHPKMEECILHLLRCNGKGKNIALLGLSTGRCAGMMYLMASSDSDVDLYRDGKPPSEAQLDWSLWEKAAAFWIDVARLKTGSPMRTALAAAEQVDKKTLEQDCIIAKAWAVYKDGGRITKDTVLVEYTPPNTDGIRKFDDWETNFGGIDVGPKRPEGGRGGEAAEEEPEPETERQVEANKKQVREERAKKDQSAINKAREEVKRKLAEDRTKREEREKVGLPKPPTRKQVEAAQTAKAKADDEKEAKSAAK